MPRRKTSLKANRANKRRRTKNLRVKQQLKKTVKNLQELLLQKNFSQAKELIGKIFSQLDKAAKKNIIHPRAASRKKSRLMRRLNKSA